MPVNPPIPSEPNAIHQAARPATWKRPVVSAGPIGSDVRLLGCDPRGAMSHEISLRDFQQSIRKMYYDKDVVRGVDGTFMWLMEEIGELAASLRNSDVANRE
jgi:hypothetical protein